MTVRWKRVMGLKPVCAALGVLVFASALPLPKLFAEDTDIPSPEAAAQQADKLTPEELTRVDIDEAMRDRLRFDPRWQPMLQAVRQDIMQLKWGEGKLENPIWKRYGAKAYPLLEFYARSRDPIRQRYGVIGIRSLGKPYTTLWLTELLTQNRSNVDFYLLTENLGSLQNSDQNQPYEYGSKNWEQEFSLNEPLMRSRLIALARKNLEPKNSPTYYDQFNLQFLANLLGYEQVYPREPDAKKSDLSGWKKFESVSRPSRQQIQAAVDYYRQLPAEAQETLLAERFGRIPAGKLSAMVRGFFQTLAADRNAADRIWAIAELDRHGDPQANAQLQTILNGDLSQLKPLTQAVSYEDYSAKGHHAYYLLVGIAQKYPTSQFVRGCREYGDLTGRSYFGGEPRSQTILNRVAKKTAVEQTRDWQQWLNRYPNHPGADDATYFLARSLQAQNNVLGATRLWLKMMLAPMGDQDSLYLAYPHIRTLLDVGLSADQIQRLAQEPEHAAVVPLLHYTMAVKYARSQDYTKALDISEKLDLTKIPNPFFERYYQTGGAWWGADNQPGARQRQMQTLLVEQRQRWRQLLSLQQENTPESRYRLASDWAGRGGWKNGYLPLWDNFRTYHLPTRYSTSSRYPVSANDRWDCRYWWVCDLSKRGDGVVRQAYQEASQNGVAIALYQKLLEDPSTPDALREKALYMQAMTLLWQWENHDPGETARIHPPAGVPKGGQKTDPYSGEVEVDIAAAYQSRLDGILTELQVKSPNSPYIDDLLFSSYYLSGRPRYLQQLVNRYPQSDRTAEAQFLLDHARPETNRG